MRTAVVLGGYGLIGAACMRSLQRSGFHVIGVGRSFKSAMSSDPEAEWRIHDIASLDISTWTEILQDADILVNASGVLQEGPSDNLTAIHEGAIARILAAAKTRNIRIVQISAAGAHEGATTEFLRSKARGDALIASQAEDWVILRPTLVIAPEAYGGTGLLRAAAALPGFNASIFPESRFQTVSLEDVTSAVTKAALHEVPSGTIADLTEAQSRSLSETLRMLRRWQGYAPSHLTVPVPNILLKAIGKVADALGHLGWRSPLRTTAIKTLKTGVTGSPKLWEDLTGSIPGSLAETLRQLPSTHQERAFARTYVVLPLAILTLSVFWITSGLITLTEPQRAMNVLLSRGTSDLIALTAVYGGSVLDLCLGGLILCRDWTKKAAAGMVGVSVLYISGSLFFAPDLWLDPLGPMVKVIPSVTLAMFVWLLVDER